MFLKGRQAGLALALATALLAGCSLTSTSRAPVESRGGQAGGIDPATLPGAENAGKPGYYTVRPGDTVFSISRANGQSWRDIARWNDLPDANVIEVGQVLRVVPPVGVAPAVATRPVTSGPDATASAGKSSASASSTPRAEKPAAQTAAAASNIKFAWPAKGTLLARFDGEKNKGIAIGGKAGDPIRAAADGSVVYAGAGLRGYGNLVIVKHDDTFLTAYAHNQKLLVKEDQKVRQGQVIAEMGSSDADRVKLHFELRRDGKPVDPLPYLPAQ
ncbi:MAG: peptidoglycan DD-metalloendopeptidase family protein [Ottowia sp.]|nr:peptidoglycan DD-metalloendopeptidase family protein [Ottowia sp.]